MCSIHNWSSCTQTWSLPSLCITFNWILNMYFNRLVSNETKASCWIPTRQHTASPQPSWSAVVGEISSIAFLHVFFLFLASFFMLNLYARSPDAHTKIHLNFPLKTHIRSVSLISLNKEVSRGSLNLLCNYVITPKCLPALRFNMFRQAYLHNSIVCTRHLIRTTVCDN
jgi:hypothetical protein